MPRSAYPPNYKLGPDNQGWLMGLKNIVQVWFTGGPRVPSGFWKWREIPKTLILLSGNGEVRWENTDGSITVKTEDKLVFKSRFYLSRIQPWCRWHFALIWPLGIHWSMIWREKYVVKYPRYQSKFGIKKMFAGYLGWIRDGDKFYKPKVYGGGNFE